MSCRRDTDLDDLSRIHLSGATVFVDLRGGIEWHRISAESVLKIPDSAMSVACMNDKPVRWGILACGKIANKFAEALKATDSSVLHAVAARDVDRAQSFAQAHGASRAYGAYEALLADPQVEAVYIATLHPFHLEWMVHAFQAGKHVLCEKPISMNLREAKRAQQVAKDNSRLLREAFMYRHHPQTQKVVDLIESGRIGKVRMIEANFCYDSGSQPESRLQAKPLGGGAILDIGCYGMSFARLIAGRAHDRLFAEPIELQAVGHLDPQLQTDMWTTAIMRFEGDIIAKISAALRVNTGRDASIYGDQGRIHIQNAWHCNEEAIVELYDGSGSETFVADVSRPLFCYEIESFVGELRGRPIGIKEVGMRYDDTLGNMKALDWWRSEIGLRYEADMSR